MISSANKLKKNIVANFLGQGWTAVMGIAFVPLYIRYLGVEAYGVIGFYAVLQAWLTLLDLGMTPTLGREMARYIGGAHSASSIRNLLRTIEILAGVIAVVAACVIWLGSGWLAGNWLNVELLPVDEVSRAISLMGLVVALRFMEGLYRGALNGLQLQVTANVVSAVLTFLRQAGVLGVLAWVAPTLQAFFVWQAAVSITSVAFFLAIVYRYMPTGVTGSFSLQHLSGVWRFAGGMVMTTVLALLLTQVDKILLSKMLPLKEFGYYALASSVASVIGFTHSPIAQAVYPRLTEILASGDLTQLKSIYHGAAQLVTVIAGSVAITLAFFSHEVLLVWSRDAALADTTSRLVTLLVIGNLLNACMVIPYMLQLAYGWSSFAARVNMIAVAILVPALLWLVPKYGAVAAASLWIALNSGYILITVHFMHRRILPEEKWRWYDADLFRPILGAFLPVITIWSFWRPELSIFAQTCMIMVAMVAAVSCSALSAPQLRISVITTFVRLTRAGG